MDSTRLWFAVVNPTSANGKTGVLWPFFLKQLKNEGWRVDYTLTTKPNDAISIVRNAIKNGYKRIISVGGDGTLNEVVNGFFENEQLINPQSELAVFGHGTGGDFIRTLKVPKGIDGFLTTLRRETKIYIDIGLVKYINHDGKACSRFFINISDAGLGGETAALVNQNSKRFGGKLSFLWGSICSILNYKNKLMCYAVDGNIFDEERINSIIVANGQFFGSGMMIAPKAQIDDGWLDVIVLGNFSTLALLYHLPKIYSGKHVNVHGVNYYRGKSVSINSPENLLLEVDGEYLGRAPLEFSIMPQKIKIWC